MSAEKKPIILVDGSSYLYRAYHALPALTNSKGFPTGAIYGVINMLKRLLLDYSPEYMAVVFDAKGKTFRDDIYSDYKATRKEMPNELVQQVEPIHQIIEKLGLPIVMVEGVEADDVIGTLTKHAAFASYNCIISTGDKDLAQLVTPKITLINTMTNNVLNTETVKEKFGVGPEKIVEYLTLVGDTSDNIPGVPQVGPKTASKWLNQYGSLDEIINNADKISGRVGENLRNTIEQIPMIKSLVTIKTDLSLPLEFTDLKIKEPDKKSLLEFYKDLEFKNWLSELLQELQVDNAATHANYETITDEKDLLRLCETLKKSASFVFKTETTTRNYMTSDLVGVSFATAQGKASYIPFGHNYPGAPKQLTKELVLQHLKPIFENAAIKKISHDIKYDLEVLAKLNINVTSASFDTMLESYVLDSASNNHSLDGLALKYLGWRSIPYEEIAGKASKQLSFDQLDLENASKFAAESTDICFRLHEEMWPLINKYPGVKHVFNTIEMPLIPVLAQIERCGVLIDPEKLRVQEKELKIRIAELEKQAFAIAGREFNINSPKQLQEILFGVLKLPVLQKTPTGQPSTADNVLQDLALDFELPKLIIEYRSLSKLMSTYTTHLVEQIDPNTGRVHTTYNQTVTSTGRLSSTDPNLQNIPIRTHEGRRIRQAFIAQEGYTLVSADYSQIELRLMAHITEDPNLLKAFTQNIDVHQATAAEVWDVPLDQVTPNMRRDAKVINFGIMYGISAFGLTRQLGIERQIAQQHIDKYFERYPRVKEYMDKTREMAREQGYVETLWGRRLYIPDIRASQIPRQRAAERAAINAPLQGSAADIIKMAMIHIEKWLREDKIPARMIMQVHDELVFEASKEHLPMIINGVKRLMTEVVRLKVPLLVSVGTGDDWDSASAH